MLFSQTHAEIESSTIYSKRCPPVCVTSLTPISFRTVPPLPSGALSRKYVFPYRVRRQLTPGQVERIDSSVSIRSRRVVCRLIVTLLERKHLTDFFGHSLPLYTVPLIIEFHHERDSTAIGTRTTMCAAFRSLSVTERALIVLPKT